MNLIQLESPSNSFRCVRIHATYRFTLPDDPELLSPLFPSIERYSIDTIQYWSIFQYLSMLFHMQVKLINISYIIHIVFPWLPSLVTSCQFVSSLKFLRTGASLKFTSSLATTSGSQKSQKQITASWCILQKLTEIDRNGQTFGSSRLCSRCLDIFFSKLNYLDHTSAFSIIFHGHFIRGNPHQADQGINRCTKLSEMPQTSWNALW